MRSRGEGRPVLMTRARVRGTPMPPLASTEAGARAAAGIASRGWATQGEHGG
jgi:hypothetical protein